MPETRNLLPFRGSSRIALPPRVGLSTGTFRRAVGWESGTLALTVNSVPSTNRQAFPISGLTSFARKVARNAAYCLVIFPVALAAFVALVTLLAVGIGLAVLFVGLPILVLMLYLARRFADVERLLLGWVLQRPMQGPRYRSAAGRRGLRRLLTPMADPQSWFDLWHGIFGLIPASIAAFMGAVCWLAGLGFTLYFAWRSTFPSTPSIPRE